MATNQYLPFATAGGANVLTPADYQALAARLSGFSAGVASSQQLNSVWRQSSVVAAMIAQFIADELNVNVLDDGNVANLEAIFIAALRTLSFRNRQVFSSSGTFVVPANIFSFKVRLWGAGGGGGGGNSTNISNSGAGGGAGAYGEKTYSGVTPGTSYAVVIGAGGIAGSSGGGTGGNGGQSSFNGTDLICPGGIGGGGGSLATNARAAGPGGVPTGADFGLAGAPGGGFIFNTTNGGGYGGTAGVGGTGGPGAGGANGGDGALPGGAGSGGSALTNTIGGVGAAGYCIVEW